MSSIHTPFGSITVEEEAGQVFLKVTYQNTTWWKSPLYPTDYQARVATADTVGQYALQILLPGGAIGLDLHLTSAQTSDNGQLHILLQDPRWSGIEVQICLQLWEEGVFTQQVSIINRLEDPITLLRADSLVFSLSASNRTSITTFRGKWGEENLSHHQSIEQGSTVLIESVTGLQNALPGTPGLIISCEDTPPVENQGQHILAALCWSGIYQIGVTHDTHNRTFTRLGHHFPAAPYLLSAGQRIDLPQALVTFSDHTGTEAGIGGATRRLHRYLRRHVLPHGLETRRNLLNSWEGVHFNVDETTLQQLITQAANLGIEMFVLDDGWFGERSDDTSSLGDWTANPRKFPHGIDHLTNFAQDRGVDFGLWIEPEMISPNSQLYRSHPEWAIRLPLIKPKECRHQLVLNLTLPEVEEFVLSTVSKLLKTNPGISYVKWDCNRAITDAACPNLFFDYITAYYRIMRSLRRNFPEVCFQCCSAGGGRLDLGAAYFHEEFWLSDMTDPLRRLYMQWSASYFFPANTIGAHVTASPNIYTKCCSSMKFRFDVAIAGRLGFELNPSVLTPQEISELKKRLVVANQLRSLIQRGDLYRLLSPYGHDEMALLYTDGQDAVLLAYTLGNYPRGEEHIHSKGEGIPIQGLHPNAVYKIEELIPNEEGWHCPLRNQTLSGNALMANKIKLSWSGPLQSVVILFRKQTVFPLDS